MKKTKILVVEDEAIIARALQLRLQQMGYDVPYVVANGEDAIDIAHKICPDLVLMDVILQGHIDGIDTARQIRSQRKIPIIYLSAYTDEMILERAKDTEPYGYLSKPFSDFDLRITIEMALYKYSAEKALRKSERKLTNIYRNTPAMMHSINSKGELISISKHWLKVLGYESDEVIGRKSADFLTAASRTYAIDVVLPDFFKSGICTDIPYQFIKKNGEILDVLLSAISEKDKAGNIINSFAVITDVTERKKAEAYLKESEERFRILFNDSTDGILIADMEEKKFFMANDTICSMLGYTKEEIIGLSVNDIHPEADLPHVIKQFERQASGEFIVAEDLPVMRKDGTVFSADIRSKPIMLSGKAYLAGVFTDITERKQSEIELQKAFEEINRLKEQLEAENVYLREEVKLQHEHGEIVGESDVIKGTLKLVEQVAGTNATVLIL